MMLNQKKTIICEKKLLNTAKMMCLSYVLSSHFTSRSQLGGFKLAKWKTNRIFEGKVEIKEKEEEQSVLGLCWNFVTDQFFYKIREIEHKQATIWTKRKTEPLRRETNRTIKK